MPIRKPFLCSLLTLLVLIIPLILSGGCDIQFGGGGGNNGGMDDEIIDGAIVDVIPERSKEGIVVQITNDDGVTFSDTTDNVGFFSIEGRFADSSAEMKFFDENDVLLARIFINVFPGVLLQLGDMTIDDGNVTFANDTFIVTYTAEVRERDCFSGNSGNLVTERQDVRVNVQITNSTLIVDNNGEDIACTAIPFENVEVRGNLSAIGNNVDASRIQLE
ncbi:hypothetical protein MYX76_03285 [Desulfobacterota bacterium AH_259_B03_O07]|nr:hypothetical protein [Desulfobacterota bacterium AH_259_B03_O07]